MSDPEELKKSIKREIDDCDQYFESLRSINDITPFIQERKDEATAKLESIENLPAEVLDEVTPNIIPLQLKDEEHLHLAIPKLPIVDPKEMRRMLVSTSSVSTSMIIHNVVSFTGNNDEWKERAVNPFILLSRKGSQKSIIDKNLDLVNQSLRYLFDQAYDEYNSTRARGVGCDTAALKMRDVVQKLWGELFDATRKNNIKEANIRGELKSERHRQIVSKTLSPYSDNDLSTAIEGLFDMHVELSGIAKDPLTNDFRKLEILFSRWMLYISNLSQLLGSLP